MFGLLIGHSTLYAQDPPTDPRLWGVWKSTYEGGGFPTYQFFTPNGAWGLQHIEGLIYGQYTASGDVFTINGTVEYQTINTWTEERAYQFSGNTLRMFQAGSATWEDFEQLIGFTGFGFIHCPATVESNMFVGAYGHVTYTDGTASRERAEPSLNGAVVKQLPEGYLFLVVGEPQCADGITWWPINDQPTNPGTPSNNNIITGWIGEGEDGVAYIEPIGWIDVSLIRPDISSESEVMSVMAGETGSTLYSPGSYPYRDQVAQALSSNELADIYPAIVDFVDTAIILVKEGTGPNPVDIACMFVSADDFWNQAALEKGSVVGCAVLDAQSHVAAFGFAGPFFYVAKQLMVPSNLIDPIVVDPVNAWADSRPITRFVCWVRPDICPVEWRPQ